MKILEQFSGLLSRRGTGLFRTIEEEIAEAVTLTWSLASGVLKGSGVTLLALPAELLSLERNFFSALFLYSYHRAGLPRPRRVMYAAINHCLRGMVTGCDNLLDDETKPTFLTDLPGKGFRFRSVLDIMVSDRVLFELLLQALDRSELDAEQVREASSATLRALTRSGAQEAGEEGGVEAVLEPATILEVIHHEKTGLLFECPWALPRLIEPVDEQLCALLVSALHQVGIGCQIMDDMVDLASDIEKRRHNYIISLVHHEGTAEERARLRDWFEAREEGTPSGDLILDFPQALRNASLAARRILTQGLSTLLEEELQSLVAPITAILATLIGAARLMSEEDGC